MCLLLIAHRAVPGYRLVVAANRDEFHGRPTAPAHAWDDPPHIVGGRDLEGGGTWLAVHREGRFATVTNVRAGHALRRGPRSRGLIVTDFLRGAHAAPDYAAELHPQAQDYDGFNLLAWDGEALAWLSNQSDSPRTLAPGIYTLSNALLDTPWPKTERLRRAFLHVMRDVPADPVPSLLAILRDNAPAADDELPDTGIGQSRERWLSSIFIEGESYGTRCSTVLTVGDDDRVQFHERRYDARAQVAGDSRHELLFTRDRAPA